MPNYNDEDSKLPEINGSDLNPPETPWEAAYNRFETPEQEIRKFSGRLSKFGAANWPNSAKIAEIFCGRGNGLRALERFGFSRLIGADLSPPLLSQYDGPAALTCTDCRHLPFQDCSLDVIIVQGGLHHLPSVKKDLEPTLVEINRVLNNGGLFVVVEPWLTPFLSFIHFVCGIALARRLSARVDALATMIHYEKETYEAWLGEPDYILAKLRKLFDLCQCKTSWGKLMFVGKKSE